MNTHVNTVHHRILQAVLFAAFTLTLSAQMPSGSARLSGRVVTLGGDPVRNARIILNTEPVSNSPLIAASDDSGQFEIQKIPAGKYQLTAARDGYVRGIYGQKTSSGPGATITIVDGQSLEAMVVTLTPMGSISGTIRNRSGEPAANVAVRALRIAYRDGTRTLLPAQVARTNDLGEYRLYYLQPARYIVSAMPFDGPTVGPDGVFASLTVLPGSPFPSASPGGVSTAISSFLTQGILSPAETGVTYLPLYFPGVADLSTATPIDLQAGAAVKSADFVVSEVRAARIRGQIRNEMGQPVKATSLALLPPANVPNVAERFGVSTDAGTLDFKGVGPGAYELIATSGNLPQGVPSTAPVGAGGVFIDRAVAAAPTTAADTRLFARASVTVADRDIENLALTMRPGYRIKGKLTFDDVSPAEAQTLISGLAIQLIASSVLQQDNSSDITASRRARAFSMTGPVAADGSFTITGAFPGTYRLAIRGGSKLPANVYVKSAILEQVDVINPRFTLDHEPAGQLELVLGIATAQVTATVTDDKQMPTVATVILVPDAARRQHFEMFFKAAADSAGKARLENIPPGDYTAYASEGVEDGAWWEPEFLRKFDGQGKAVRIQAGRTSDISLKSVR